MTSGLYLGPDIPLADGAYGAIALSNGIFMREIAGRTGTDTSGAGTASRTWLVWGNSDPLVCRAALLAGPINILAYDGMNIENLDHDIFEAADAWKFTANYNRTTPSVASAENTGYTVSIDTTGGTILQTSSYAQTRYAIAGKTAPDFLKSIDVQDGQAQGVERIIPALKITVKAKIATEYVISPLRYSKLIASLTGTTNNAPIFDDGDGEVFEAGELLFAGANGSVISEDPQLDFIFLASANLEDGTIGGITGINKKGHDYIWFLFDADKDGSTGMLIHKPRACYVDQVYGPADHSLLKIGVAPT